MTGFWRRETGQQLRIVCGDDWIAGLIGISARDRPSPRRHSHSVMRCIITGDGKVEGIDDDKFTIAFEGSRK